MTRVLFAPHFERRCGFFEYLNGLFRGLQGGAVHHPSSGPAGFSIWLSNLARTEIEGSVECQGFRSSFSALQRSCFTEVFPCLGRVTGWVAHEQQEGKRKRKGAIFLKETQGLAPVAQATALKNTYSIGDTRI
jgi:hypothetical protein